MRGVTQTMSWVLVEREDGMGLRSSMMGDRFEVDGVDYRVALAGFKEVA